jgi:predicted AAA+ superfamily ATPase
MSFMLLGPRQTGKSTLICSLLPDQSWIVDLLKTDEFLKYSQNPSQLRLDATFQISKNHVTTIFIDEIQRLPELLNEIQSLLSLYPQTRFIVTGSSARKLKRSHSNLLAGRLIQEQLFPFTYHELKTDFDLKQALVFGTLPAIYGRTDDEKKLILQTYAQTYLREEIQQEALVRNLGSFTRFLNVAAAQFTELTKYQSIASECQVPASTVKGFYEILEDTLIGFRLYGWNTSPRKQLSTYPKFYLFDNGVTNSLNHLLGSELSPVVAGKLFEQWVLHEVRARFAYGHSEHGLFYWRTNNDMEVDLLIGHRQKILAAIEIKYSANI